MTRPNDYLYHKQKILLTITDLVLYIFDLGSSSHPSYLRAAELIPLIKYKHVKYVLNKYS